MKHCILSILNLCHGLLSISASKIPTIGRGHLPKLPQLTFQLALYSNTLIQAQPSAFANRRSTAQGKALIDSARH